MLGGLRKIEVLASSLFMDNYNRVVKRLAREEIRKDESGEMVIALAFLSLITEPITADNVKRILVIWDASLKSRKIDITLSEGFPDRVFARSSVICLLQFLKSS